VPLDAELRLFLSVFLVCAAVSPAGARLFVFVGNRAYGTLINWRTFGVRWRPLCWSLITADRPSL